MPPRIVAQVWGCRACGHLLFFRSGRHDILLSGSRTPGTAGDGFLTENVRQGRRFRPAWHRAKIKIAKSDKCHSNRVDGLLLISAIGLLGCYQFNMLLPPEAPEPQQRMIDAEAHSSLSCLDCRYSPGGYSRRTNICPVAVASPSSIAG